MVLMASHRFCWFPTKLFLKNPGNYQYGFHSAMFIFPYVRSISSCMPQIFPVVKKKTIVDCNNDFHAYGYRRVANSWKKKEICYLVSKFA